ncbi:DUF1657 domain-containing protein [Peribacillus muralis]|uniref:DUF1657 domain-containing protein n=1 Tax=Peribacillus muralis TaxID=264697 RepID=UPI00070F87BC|nr:DUF1657 domain-containing protein [Peribacillus muralis]MCK1994145.1 DUF1657 domain-containing protein [Peribacillus muralis]MCK2014700.1 DUF1657 domain-containing protein [Peribacillus muralis]
MTIASDVKQCVSSLKGIEAGLSSLALRTQDDESKRILHETMLVVNEVMQEVQQRVGELEQQEPQYEGF